MPQWTLDLALNLVSELFGIAVTVLLIERSLKIREEKRWAPSKNYLYIRLCEFTDKVMSQVLPITITGSKMYYFFGDVVGSSVEHEINFDSFEENRKLEDEISLELTILTPDEKINKADCLIERGEELGNILTSGMVLIEPELLTLLLNLKGRLEKMELTKRSTELTTDVFPRPKDYLDLFAIELAEIAKNTDEVKGWIKTKTRAVKTDKEFEEEIFGIARAKREVNMQGEQHG